MPIEYKKTLVHVLPWLTDLWKKRQIKYIKRNKIYWMRALFSGLYLHKPNVLFIVYRRAQPENEHKHEVHQEMIN